MSTRVGNQDDGIIGLGVLVLMTVALIAGQLHGASDEKERLNEVSLVGSHMLIDDSGDTDDRIGGSLRELRILPSAISEYTQLDWSTEDELIRKHRSAGL